MVIVEVLDGNKGNTAAIVQREAHPCKAFCDCCRSSNMCCVFQYGSEVEGGEGRMVDLTGLCFGQMSVS